MRTNCFSTGLLAGLLFGVIAAYMFSGGSAHVPCGRRGSKPRARFGPATLHDCHLGVPVGAHGPNYGTHSEHGAYVLDTRSGKVWQIKDDGKPQLLGSVE